jgi:hypothetical protein
MRSFILARTAAAVLSVFQESAAEAFSTEAVRL